MRCLKNVFVLFMVLTVTTWCPETKLNAKFVMTDLKKIS